MKLSDFVGNNPFDRNQWPEQLTARVVQPGDSPTLFGYAVQEDLARHYRWTDSVYLCLTGELPEEKAALGVELAFHFLSCVSVAEAPGHAAVLSGFCGITPSAAISVVTIALAEQGRVFVEKYLAHRKDQKTATSTNPKDAGIERLQALLEENGLTEIKLETGLGVLGAALSVLEQCGLTKASQLEAAWVMARLPSTLAEVWQQPASQFIKYPTQLPRFEYQHPRQK